MSKQSSPESTAARSGIWGPSFQGLLWTQWLSAINDNIFRWFVIGVGKDQFAPEDLGTLLVVGSAFFIVPYILFAPVAGWLADRFKKSRVIVWCKVAEIVIMSLGVLAVSLMGKPNPSQGVDPYFYWLLVTVFFMGMQSALFAPAKIGTIPELLGEKTIATGNGIFNLATLSATIIGMAVGGLLSDVTSRGQTNLGLAAAVLIGVAVVGTLVSFLVRSLPAANRNAAFPWNLPERIFHDIRQLFSYGVLFRVALGIVFFWSIAAFAQLNIDVFAEESGGLLESDRTILLIAVTLGIGLGSVLAGWISAGRIELGLVPLGAMGIAVFSILLWCSPAEFINDNPFSPSKIFVCLLLGGLGVSAGVFDVPLASYLQHNSPIEKRGTLLAATNCIAFGGILLFFGVLAICRAPTFEGSVSNLPVEWTAASLSPEENEEVQVLLSEFEATPIDEGHPGVRVFVDRADPAIQTVVLTELVMADANRRRLDQSSLTLGAYRKEFEIARDPTTLTSDQEREIVIQENRTGRQIKQSVIQSGKLPLLSARQVFLLMGLVTLPVVWYSVRRLIRPMVRLLFWLGFTCVYRLRIRGEENFPKTGGAIVVANHTSWLDGVIMVALVPRTPRTVAWAGNFSSWIMKKWADFCGLILVTGGPKSIRKGLETARQAVRDGEVVGLFSEGGISREGQIKALKPGLAKIIDPENPVPVIPVYIDELWGSVFSYFGGKSLNRLPNTFRRPLSLHIGKPVENPDSLFAIRQALQQLSAQTVKNRSGKFVAPVAQFVKQCKQSKFRSKIADSTGPEETGGTLLMRALVLRRLFRRHVLKSDDQHVGVLIPPSVGGTIVNMALSLDQRIATNLNYSLSNNLINHCVAEAEVKTILTTRKVAEKFGFEFDCDVFFLEDLKDKVTLVDKLVGALQSFLVPRFILTWLLGLNQIQPDDTLTVVFTSGSTGVPKGVMLTQLNVMCNVEGIERVGALVPGDTLIGVLPFFHSMGYTVGMWVPMATAIRGVYHFSPLDAKVIGKLTQKFRGTIIVATPTFLRSYLRRCTAEQFESLDMVIAGAERVPTELCEEFEKKFGVRPVEGYGTTELSPVASVNVPYSRQSKKKFQTDAKEGTVGRPMPHVAAKITDLDTGEALGPNVPGMLWITGPTVMKGYLNNPEATAEVLVDGWYKTGDVAIIDDDGFIKITGRMSRFSKIGGEMVPHLKIEEVLSKFLDETPCDDSDDHLQVAVSAVPDVKKGERLVVLFTPTGNSVDEMRQALKANGLPNIFIPNANSFFEVASLPILGTGKLDLRGIKDLALEKCSSEDGSEG